MFKLKIKRLICLTGIILTAAVTASAQTTKISEHLFNGWTDNFYKQYSYGTDTYYTFDGNCAADKEDSFSFNDGNSFVLRKDASSGRMLSDENIPTMKYRLYLRPQLTTRAIAIGTNAAYNSSTALSNNDKPYVRYTTTKEAVNNPASGSNLIIETIIRCDTEKGAGIGLKYSHYDAATGKQNYNSSLFSMQSDGNVRVNNTTPAKWQTGKEYKVSLVLKIGTPYADVYFDGKLIAKDAYSFWNDKNTVDGILSVDLKTDFTEVTDESKLVYFDDFRIYSGDYPTAVSTDKSVSVSEAANVITVPSGMTVGGVKSALEDTQIRAAKDDFELLDNGDIIEISDGVFERNYEIVVEQSVIRVKSAKCFSGDEDMWDSFKAGKMTYKLGLECSENDVPLSLFLAQYDSNKELIALSCNQITADKSTDSIECDINIEKTDNTIMKALLLNSRTMQPMCKAIVREYKETKTEAAVSENVKYTGRWITDGEVKQSNWGGAYAEIAFTGTTCRVKLDSGNTPDLYVVLDGKASYFSKNRYINNPQVYNSAAGELNVADNLSEGQHTLRIASRHTSDTRIFLRGFVVDSDAEVSAPSGTGKLIEFIGDSITTGAMGEDNVWRAQDTYAWLTAEKLGYEHTQISANGICLTGARKNWLIGMNEHYFDVSPSDQSETRAKWDMNSYTPDVIIINLGQNDSGADKIPTAAEFTAAYTEFVKNIRTYYPNAEIFMMRPYSGAFEGAVKSAAEQLNAKNDLKVHYVDTTGWIDRLNDCPDTVHPNTEAHKRAADKLSEIIGQYL